MNRLMTFIWLICLSVRATTNYYSFTDGNDANDGLTIATCKKLVPGMIGAGAYSHSPSNDIFVWKAGDTWPAACWPLLVGWSGTNNIANPDSYRTNGSWGTGLAFGQASHSKSNMFIVSQVTNIDMWGLGLSGTGGSVMHDNSGIVSFFQTANFNAYYCHFHDWLTTATGRGSDTAHGGWIGNNGSIGSGWGYTNIGCHYCEIDNVENGASGNWNGDCVQFGGLMDHCFLHDSGSAILYAQDVSYCVISNISYPYFEYDSDFHENGFYMDNPNWAAASTGGKNLYCRNTIFVNCAAGANMAYANIEKTDCYVYNDLFYGVQGDQQAINIDTYDFGSLGIMHSCYIYNDTIVIYDSSAPTGILLANRAGIMASNVFQTNLLLIGASANTNSLFVGNSAFLVNGQQGNNIALTPSAASAQGYNGPTWAPTIPTFAYAGANLASLGLSGLNWTNVGYASLSGSPSVLLGIPINGAGAGGLEGGGVIPLNNP